MGKVLHPNLPAADQHHGGLSNLLLGHVFEGVVSRKIAGREDVSHQDQSVINDPFWGLYCRRVCQWNAHLTRVSSVLPYTAGPLHIPPGPRLELLSQITCFWSI